MKLRKWYNHYIRYFINQRISQFRNEDFGTALAETGRFGWIGAMSAAGKLLNMGTIVWNQGDWDVLVILDACRVDALREVATEYEFLPTANKIGTIKSVGGCTPEWLNATFDARFIDQIRRTGYVTANPQTAADHGAYGNLPIKGEKLALLDEVWKTSWQSAGTQTVPPKPVTDSGISWWRNRETHNLDRMIVHYIQPHEPYRSLDQQERSHPSKVTVGAADTNAKSIAGIWKQLRRGQIDRSTVWSAYLDNLRWVLDEIKIFLENVDGRVAITADHGEAFGEWGVYAHPTGCPLPVVREVPWVEIEATDRRTRNLFQQTDTSVSFSKGDVAQRLEALGYR